jgi:hypothetical protein
VIEDNKRKQLVTTVCGGKNNDEGAEEKKSLLLFLQPTPAHRNSLTINVDQSSHLSKDKIQLR